ncbi:hypothetical protein CHS0354_012996 [Potamilus streckersoni]|uniref:N-acylethanolamine-hydrolyzing acid amidase n=1 Tax=Potamilus streckersoni TaxID=2493646 RepID=A0AAE0T7D8_9BIVA|nr:hypothetical protein CHS0354_012996 [Potamilus streckersoni]
MKQLQGFFLASGMLFLTLGTVDTQGVITNYVVNLDAPPELRWIKVVEDYKEIVKFAHSVIRSYVPENLIPLVEEIGADIDNYIKQPYATEMRGIAKALNCSLGDVVLVNLIYDISAFCTSIVSQDDHGQIWHSRNLDYDFGDMLRNITIHVDFNSQGQTVYSAITYAGYIGILSGQKPMAFSITVDERDQGSIFENILLAILDKKAVPMSFLVRDTLANQPDFESAIKHLSTTDTVSSVYFILAGVNPGEGAVITKERLETIDIWRLDPDQGRWFVVETNYDHWTTPPPSDDRRDPANKAMTRLGQQNINKVSLFAVMSVQPVLNNHTTYTVIMSPAQPQLMQAWIRNCS